MTTTQATRRAEPAETRQPWLWCALLARQHVAICFHRREIGRAVRWIKIYRQACTHLDAMDVQVLTTLVPFGLHHPLINVPGPWLSQ